MPSDIDIYRQKLTSDPLDISAFSALRNHFMKSGMFLELAELLEVRASHLGGDAEAADLYHRAGEILVDKLGDTSRGTEAFLRALEVAPNHRGSAERLDGIYREAGDYEALLQVLTRWVEGLETYEPGKESAGLRSHLYQQIGEIWGSYYQRSDVAVSFYKRATQADPTNVMAIYLAREIYIEAGSHETASRLYDMEINAEPDNGRKVALGRELAILQEQQLQDIDSAIVTLEKALAIAPTNPDLLYELGTAVMRQVDGGQDSPEHRKVAADAFHRLSQLSDAEVALQYLDTALDLYPGHEAGMDQYESHCAQDGRWEDLRLRLERCLDSVTADEDRVPLLRRLGRLHLERLQDEEQALSYFERLGDFGDPADLDVLRQLRAGQIPDASAFASVPAPVAESSAPAPVAESSAPAPVAESSAPAPVAESSSPAPVAESSAPAPAAEPSAPVPAPAAPAPEPEPEPEPELPPVDEALVKKLRTDGEKLQKLGMVEKAEAKMLQVVEMVPDEQGAWAFLEKRMRSTGRFDQLRDLLMSTADNPRLDPETSLHRLREAAAISETRLRDMDASVEIYKRMLRLDPDNEDARKSFERILNSAKRWDDLVEYLDEESYRVIDPQVRYELCQRIADIHLLRRDDPRSAYDVWWRAYEVRPDDLEILHKLDELALRMRDWEELDRVLAMQLDKSEEPEERLALFKRMASIEEESIENVQAALETSRACHEEFPEDLENLRRLVRLQSSIEDFEGQLETLPQLFELSEDEEERSQALRSLAIYTWDLSDDADMASAYWEKYLERVPGDLEAYERYGELLESLGRHEELVTLFRKLLEDESLAEHHRAFMRRLGLLLSSEALDRRDEAMDVWRKLLEGGDDLEALATLAAWDREKEKWPELVDNLERQARLAEEPERRAAILRDRAEILYDQLQEPNRALETLSEVLEVLPEDRGTLTQMRVIQADIEEFESAAETLERELQVPMEADEQRELLVLLSSWYHERLQNWPGAISAYERILALEPGDFQAISALEELYEKEEEWEKLLRLVRTKTKAEQDEAERLGLLLKGARVCEEKLEDGDRAWSWYREIFSRVEVDDDVMSVIEEAAHRLEQWGDLAIMYEDLAPHAEEVSAQVLRWRQAAQMYSEKLGDHGRALHDVYQAVLVDPDEVELLDLADREALECQDWERLGAIYERISRGIDDVEGRVHLLKRFSEVVWRKGGFARGAVMPLLRAVEEMPQDGELFEAFYEASLEAGEYSELLGAFDRRFRRSQDDEEKLELKLRMARIMAEYLQNVDGAIKIIQEAVEVDPSNERFAQLIFEAARGVEENLDERNAGYVYTWLLKTYQAHADSYEASDPVRIVFLRQIARIYREGLRDVPSAFNAMRESHRLSPADLVLLEGLESMAEQESYWEALADHYQSILRLSLKQEHAQIIHDRRARILAEELDRQEEAAEHYWQLIQMNPDHPTAFRKLSDFYRSVGRYNDLLVILESAVERTEDDDQRIALLREIASVWDQDLNNRFEALDAYKKILSEQPDDDEAQEAVERLQKSRLGLAARLGGDEEEDEDEEDVDVEELRRTLLEDDLSDVKPTKPPPPPAKSDELPDWDDAIETGEVPLQRVSQLLAMSKEGDEEGTISARELDDATGPQDAPAVFEGEEPPPAIEQGVEGEPAQLDPAGPIEESGAAEELSEEPAESDDAGPSGEETLEEDDEDALQEIDGAALDQAIADSEDLQAQEEDSLPGWDEEESRTPVEPEQAAGPGESETAFVLDDDSLNDMLEEEYQVDEFDGSGGDMNSQPPPLPSEGDGDADSLPPPPPAVKKKGQKLGPPPPPPRKKRG